MAYFIDFLEGSRAELKTHEGEVLRIGRGTNADLRLDDPAVALEHAVIVEEAGGWILRDLGSLTGTLLRGDPVAEHRLADGDRLEIGPFQLEVETLGEDDPLFLHIARPGATGTIGATRTLKASSRELLNLATRHVSEIERTKPIPVPTVLIETPEKPPQDDAYETLRAPFVPPTQMPAADVPDAAPTAPPATPPAMPPPAAPRPPAAEVPAIDYAGAYSLEGRRPLKAWLAFVLSLVVAGAVFAVVQGTRNRVFSPGALTNPHRTATQDSCAACHPGWEPVTVAGCQASGCHATTGEHQADLAVEPSCLACHTEHRDLQALRLLGDGGCVGCHGNLETASGEVRFAERIVGFGEGEHPDFTPRSDSGGLLFHHAWHLEKVVRNGVKVLDCSSCHVLGEDGELRPVAFEEHCQRCHNLAFDRRFGDEEAPHGAAREVLTQLAGRYVLRPFVLRNLRREESDRLRGRSLSQEEQLAVVAEINTRSLLRNKCFKCHRFTPPDPRRADLDKIAVRPTRIRDRWLEHAVFRHAPHLELHPANGCETCHTEARTSRRAEDVLLPKIASCRECHRPPRSGESPDDVRLGDVRCRECHMYHPEPGERLAFSQGEPK